MKKQVYEVDAKGFLKEIYIAEVDKNGTIIDVDKQGFVTLDFPSNLFRPKWIGTKWIEGATQAEIDELTKPQLTTPTLEQRIAELENTILNLLEVL